MVDGGASRSSKGLLNGKLNIHIKKMNIRVYVLMYKTISIKKHIYGHCISLKSCLQVLAYSDGQLVTFSDENYHTGVQDENNN